MILLAINVHKIKKIIKKLSSYVKISIKLVPLFMFKDSSISYLNFLKNSGVTTFLQNEPNFYYIKKKINENLTNINIDDIKDLISLKTFILKLKNKNIQNNKIKIIIGEGNKKAKLMIIGEFPDNEEIEYNKSIAGESENLLNKMLKAINLERDDVYTTNVFPWSKNKNLLINNRDILECMPLIQKQIEIVSPKLILLMGEIATKAILNSSLTINQLREKWHHYNSINLIQPIKCLVTFHPKHLIKFSSDKKFVWSDLQKLQSELNNEDI